MNHPGSVADTLPKVQSGLQSTRLASHSRIRHLDSKFAWCILTLLIGTIAGSIIFGVGVKTLQGPLDNLRLMTAVWTVAGGAILTITACGGLVSLVMLHKQHTISRRKPVTLLTPQERILAFAREKLKHHKNIQPQLFGYVAPSDLSQLTRQDQIKVRTLCKKIIQPINTEISLMTTLFWDVCFLALEQALEKNRENPWSNDEVIKAADELFKMGYAITALTLKELPLLVQKFKDMGEERTEFSLIDDKKGDTYANEALLTQHAYYLLRTGLHITDEGLTQFSCIPEEHAKKFFQEGKFQEWRVLYNEHCDAVSAIANRDSIDIESRVLNWHVKDENPSTFNPYPDTKSTKLSYAFCEILVEGKKFNLASLLDKYFGKKCSTREAHEAMKRRCFSFTVLGCNSQATQTQFSTF